MFLIFVDQEVLYILALVAGGDVSCVTFTNQSKGWRSDGGNQFHGYTNAEANMTLELEQKMLQKMILYH